MKALYSEGDFKRESGSSDDSQSAWRKSFYRDYARVLHSASFRRLQGKTQVFPGHESDFFRNRLTHSLEVAQIAEGIAFQLNYNTAELAGSPVDQQLDARLCSVASLAHDLGHPPFGHNGERALDDAMRGHGGFEGNAQTLRILSRLEKKVRAADDSSLGLDLTYRTLASILKYGKQIPRTRRKSAKLVKGYYYSEKDLVGAIKKSVTSEPCFPSKDFKTIECSIMDLADDIAYSTYDLEDSLKAGFITPADALTTSEVILDSVAAKVSGQLERAYSRIDVLKVLFDVFSASNSSAGGSKNEIEQFTHRYRAFRDLGASSYLRTTLSSQLVNEAVNSVTLKYNEQIPALSMIVVPDRISERIEVLKQYVYVQTIFSSRVKIPEYRGYEVVSGIFAALAGERGFLLMPDDVRSQYETAQGDYDLQMRVVCDFVAGMTDRYAMEFFGRLHSDTAQSMFKPV